MKKNIYRYIITGLLLTGIVACKKNNLVVDKDPLVVPEAARFINYPGASNNYYSYFIQENPAPGSIFNQLIGATTVSGTDRKVKLTYSSLRATAGVQYTGPAELTIPAGATTVNLPFQGLFAGYPTGRKDTVKIKITSADGFIKPNAYKDSIMLIMQKYCTVVLANLSGDYDNTIEYSSSGAVSWGPYTTVVKNVTSTGATTAEADIENIYDYGGQVHAKFDWTDPANFKVTIAEQNTGAIVVSGGTPYQLWIRTNGSTSTFSSCDNNITVRIDAIAKSTTTGATVGNFSTNYRIVLSK